MHQLSYENHDSIPVFKCTLCGSCAGLETENHLGLNRGCCFYFPRYTLITLRTIAGIDRAFLDWLQHHPDAAIDDYELVIKGDYDRVAHDSFLRQISDEQREKYRHFDTSLFFRKCRFVSEKGCAIAFNLRPHPCNLYLCRGVIDRCGDTARDYARERKDYFAYCHYMDGLLEDALCTHELTLKTDFQKAIDVLLATPVDSFCFSELAPIEFE